MDIKSDYNDKTIMIGGKYFTIKHNSFSKQVLLDVVANHYDEILSIDKLVQKQRAIGGLSGESIRDKVIGTENLNEIIYYMMYESSFYKDKYDKMMPSDLIHLKGFILVTPEGNYYLYTDKPSFALI